jgi:hypothetical protein
MVIKPEHIELAAMFFTISNLGQPRPRRLKDIKREYDQMHETFYAECGIDTQEELDDWLQGCHDQGTWEVKEWNKFLDTQPKEK